MPILDADRIVAALRGAFNREVGRTGILGLAAERIQAAGAPYTSVYMYMLHGDEGVCGTAVATGEDQNVPDVRAIENYIACNTWTRSELVVLIRRGETILGQIDVDSDEPDPFTEAEEAAVRQVADAVAVLI
jgi:putative methionine-R-sulfoxide reductase with GAF domain